MAKTSAYITSSETGATRDGEHKDCVVRALSNVSGMSYDIIHMCMGYHGRKEGECSSMQQIVAMTKNLGMVCQPYGKGASSEYLQWVYKKDSKGNKTLGNLIKDLPKGKFAVLVKGHMLALIDGKVIDTFDNSANKQVLAIFYKPE